MHSIYSVNKVPQLVTSSIFTTSFIFQSNLLFADGSSLELAGKDGGVGSLTGGVPTLEPEHPRRMEAAPHAPMDDGFGGTIGDVADFGRELDTSIFLQTDMRFSCKCYC